MNCSLCCCSVPAAALRKAARGAPTAGSEGLSKAEQAKSFHKLLTDEAPDSSDDYVAPRRGTAAGSVPSAIDEL